MLLRRVGSNARPLGSITGGIVGQRRHVAFVPRYKRGNLPPDLRLVTTPIGCLYGGLPDADEYAAFMMSEQVVQHFNLNGWAMSAGPIFSHEQCNLLCDEVNQLSNEYEPHPKSHLLYSSSVPDTNAPVFYCQGAWRAGWGVHDLVYCPAITVPCSQFVGNRSLRVWYDEVLVKAPKVGPCIPWQQNYARWQHMHPINHVTALIALDSLTRDRSAPCVVSGSHRWRDGLVPCPTFDPSRDENEHLNSIFEIANDEEREQLVNDPPITIELERGQVLFIHPLLLHATHANRSLEPARCASAHYFGEPTYATKDGWLLPQTTRFTAGSPVASSYFPLVFDPSIIEGEMPQQPSLPDPTSTGEDGFASNVSGGFGSEDSTTDGSDMEEQSSMQNESSEWNEAEVVTEHVTVDGDSDESTEGEPGHPSSTPH